MARLAGMTVAEVQANRLETARGFARALRRDGGAERRADADCASRWTRGREYHRQSRHGEGRQRRSADGADCRAAGAVSRRRGAGGGSGGLSARAGRGPGGARRATSTLCWPPIAWRNFRGLFAFDSRGENGYVWLQGALHAAAVPGEVRGMSDAAPAAEGRIHEFTTKSGADTIEVGRKLARAAEAAATAAAARRPGHRQNHAGEGHCAGAGRGRGGRGDQPDLYADARVRRQRATASR